MHQRQEAPTQPVVGVDACKAGWVGVVWWSDLAVEALVATEIGELVDRFERVLGTRPVVAGIDIPIGLPDSGRRSADVLARVALPGKSSSVFPTLVRAAYEADDYTAGRAAMRTATADDPDGPRSCSAQAWQLGAKILEVDEWARVGDSGTRVVEIHPEVSFAAMVGEPLLEKKRTPEGESRRRSVLREAGIDAPTVTPRGSAADDLLDACAVAWSAARVLTGHAHCLPDPPEVHSDGWPAAIHV